MSYEPRGKVKALIDAMRAAAAERPVWTSVEVAKVLETSTNSVPAFVATAINHDVLFHKMENGRSRYSLKPFAPAATAAPAPPRETTATGWRPPTMGTPRCTPAPTAAPVATPAPAQPAAEPAVHVARFVPALAKVVEAAASAAAQPPQITPVPPVEAAEPALTIELDAPLDEQQQDEPEPLTWSIWDDGDVDLFGLVELENGGYRIQAKDVARLRRMLAWLPA